MIELLVVMSMFVGIMAIAYAVLGSIQQQTADTSARSTAVTQSRQALAQIDRQVRSGNVLYDPAAETVPRSMRIYTQANGDQRCVQWQVLDGALRTRSWSPTWQTDGIVSAWRTVARELVNEQSGVAPFSLHQGGTSTAFGARVVDLVLLTKVSTSGGKPVEVKSSLSGRNTNYGFDTGVCSATPTL